MAKNSLFAVLLRSPWWISFAVAAALFAIARLFMPELYAAFVKKEQERWSKVVRAAHIKAD